MAAVGTVNPHAQQSDPLHSAHCPFLLCTFTSSGIIIPRLIALRDMVAFSAEGSTILAPVSARPNYQKASINSGSILQAILSW